MLVELHEPAEARGLKAATDAVAALLDALAAADLPATADELLQNAWQAGKPAALRESVAAVMKLPRDQRVAVATAFHDDVRFSENPDDTGFRFAFLTLDDEPREASRGLFEAMYDGILTGSGTGFPLPAGDEKVTAKLFETIFDEANNPLRICPACLHNPLDLDTGGSRRYDLEHAFPKSIYATLAVHPHNLVPACMPCNQREHGDLDPLCDDEGGPYELSVAYIPYRRSAQGELVVQFDPDADRHHRVLVRGVDPPAERRVRTHARLYGIDRVWSSCLESLHNRVRLFVDGEEATTIEEVEAALRKNARRQRKQVRFASDALLEAEYCEWLVANSLETFAREVLRGR